MRIPGTGFDDNPYAAIGAHDLLVILSRLSSHHKVAANRQGNLVVFDANWSYVAFIDLLHEALEWDETS